MGEAHSRTRETSFAENRPKLRDESYTQNHQNDKPETTSTGIHHQAVIVDVTTLSDNLQFVGYRSCDAYPPKSRKPGVPPAMHPGGPTYM